MGTEQRAMWREAIPGDGIEHDGPELSRLLEPSSFRANPSILLLNTASYLHELSRNNGGGMRTVGTLSDKELEDIIQGHDLLYAMGVWQRSPAARAMAFGHKDREYVPIVPSLRDDEVIGSAFSITGYIPDAAVARSSEEFKGFRERIHSRGAKLIVDFIPNHTGIDHHWVRQYPDRYVHIPHGNRGDSIMNADRNIALARDPNFGSWEDVVQLNYALPETQEAMIQELHRIAAHADGVRADMAMLVNPETFVRTWGWAIGKERADWIRRNPFWPKAIREIKREHPRFTFIAESYWDEPQLLEWGFDYAYAKESMYEMLKRATHGEPISNIRSYLKHLSSVSRSRQVRFIENHDEQRARVVFGDAAFAAAAATAFIPDGLFLIHDGQDAGWERRVPMQIKRYGDEAMRDDVRRFYRSLRQFRDSTIFQRGGWSVEDPISVGPGWGTAHHLLSYRSSLPGEGGLITLSNFSTSVSEGFIRLDSKRYRVFDPHEDRWLHPKETARQENGHLYVRLRPWGVQYVVYAS